MNLTNILKFVKFEISIYGLSDSQKLQTKSTHVTRERRLFHRSRVPLLRSGMLSETHR